MVSQKLKRSPEYSALIAKHGNPMFYFGVFHIFRNIVNSGKLQFTVFDSQNLYTVIENLDLARQPRIADYIPIYTNPQEIAEKYPGEEDRWENIVMVRSGVFDKNLDYDDSRELFIEGKHHRLFNRWDVVEKVWYWIANKLF